MMKKIRKLLQRHTSLAPLVMYLEEIFHGVFSAEGEAYLGEYHLSLHNH